MVILEGNRMQTTGNITYTRKVGDLADISTPNASFTNSFSIIGDNISTRAFKGLGIPSNISDVPYKKFKGVLLLEEVVVSKNPWITILGKSKGNFKVSVLDGNISFWQAVQDLTLADLDLKDAIYAKTYEGITDSFTDENVKYIIADYGGKINPYEINHLNPAISEKYIWDAIFDKIGMRYSLTPDIDSWLVIGKSEERPYNFLLALVLEIDNGTHPDFEPTYSNIEEYLIDFEPTTRRIEILDEGVYKFSYNATTMTSQIAVMDSQGNISIENNMPINHYIEINGIQRNWDEEIYILPSDDVFVRFEPITNEQLQELPFFSDYTVHKGINLTIFDYYFEAEKIETAEFTFEDDLQNVKVVDFVKWIMHKYALTLFYEDKFCNFMTMDERLNADVEDLNPYLIETIEERYLYLNY